MKTAVPARAGYADRLLVAAAVAVCRLVTVFAWAGRAFALLAASPATLDALASLGGRGRSLWKISRARVFHQMVRAVPRLGAAASAMLLPDIPRGHGPCVYALVHSHWNALLSRRAVESEGPLVLASARWASRLEGLRLEPAPRGLRRLVGALRTGGSVAVMADAMEAGGERVCFLGRQTRLSTGAARIASAGRAPLVPVSAAFSGGRVRIRTGAPIPVDRSAEGIARATRELAAFFDRAVGQDADAWYRLLPFLAGAAPTSPASGNAGGSRLFVQRMPSAR
jgi:hypothetical protein